MSNFVWLVVIMVFSAPFAIRGIAVAWIGRRFLRWRIRNCPITANFCSLLFTIAVVAMFPPHHTAGNWLEVTTSERPNPVDSYRLDKTWFGAWVYYRFPGPANSTPVSVLTFRPSTNSVSYRLMEAAAAIDYPILSSEVVVLIAYLATTSRRKNNANRVDPKKRGVTNDQSARG